MDSQYGAGAEKLQNLEEFENFSPSLWDKEPRSLVGVLETQIEFPSVYFMFPNENSAIDRVQPYGFERAVGKMLHDFFSVKDQAAFGTALKAEKIREHMWDGVHLYIGTMNTVEKTTMSVVTYFFSYLI